MSDTLPRRCRQVIDGVNNSRPVGHSSMIGTLSLSSRALQSDVTDFALISHTTIAQTIDSLLVVY